MKEMALLPVALRPVSLSLVSYVRDPRCYEISISLKWGGMKKLFKFLGKDLAGV